MRSREGKIWYCLTANAAISTGTRYFYRYFGGEIIYWPFKTKRKEGDEEILSVLERIGRPVIVEAFLMPNELQFFGDESLAESFLSHFGCTVNPEFFQLDKEGFTIKPLSPDHIVRVWETDVFFKKYTPKRS